MRRECQSFTEKIYSAALYIRLSREDGDKEESDSVSNQKKLLTEYLKKGEFQIYDIYIDDGYSGTDFNRPGFKKMMEDIYAGLVNCVIVKDLSRFGRDYIDTGRYLERVFPELGIRFISVTDGIDSLYQTYDILLPIKNIFNEQYARDISQKIRATMRAKQKAGEFIGAFACYGYRKDPCNRNRLLIDEYPASIVKTIFSLFLEGKSKQEIADILNERGVLCPSRYKISCGENYRSRAEKDSGWTYSTIYNMLHNQIYTGAMVQGKKYQKMRSSQHMVKKDEWIIVQDTHEAIIDQKTWRETQRLLGQRRRACSGEYSENPFSGLIFCGCCKKPMILNRWKRADGKMSASFYCGTYKRKGKSGCTPHAIPAELLESIIYRDMQKLLEHDVNLQELRQKVWKQQMEEKRLSRKKEQSRAETSCNKMRRLKQQVYEDYREGLLSRREFMNYTEDYTKKEQFYMDQMEHLKDMEDLREEKRTWKGNHANREEGFGRQTISAAVKKRVLMELIDHIEVREEKFLDVYYNFSQSGSG